MNEIVNLNHVRKTKRRAADVRAAAGNRVKFGRTAAQRAADRAVEAARRRALDQARRDP